MRLTRRERLASFIEQMLDEAGKRLEGTLTDDTSLIESGLLDSLAILSLAKWIDEELGGDALDLESVDFLAEWDSIGAILRSVDTK